MVTYILPHIVTVTQSTIIIVEIEVHIQDAVMSIRLVGDIYVEYYGYSV